MGIVLEQDGQHELGIHLHDFADGQPGAVVVHQHLAVSGLRGDTVVDEELKCLSPLYLPAARRLWLQAAQQRHPLDFHKGKRCSKIASSSSARQLAMVAGVRKSARDMAQPKQAKASMNFMHCDSWKYLETSSSCPLSRETK